MQKETSTLGKYTSIWMDTAKSTDYPALPGDLDVDIAIIGGGIAGLLSAFFMKKAGFKVAVIESGRIATGTTGYTTAKITSAHSIIYKHLIDDFGKPKARIYASANEEAIKIFADIIHYMKIDCDFERVPAYTFSTDFGFDKAISEEFAADKSLGL